MILFPTTYMILLFYLIGSFFAPVRISHERLNQVKTVTISAAGDLMCHSPQFQSAQIAKDSFDFRPVFGEIKSYLSSSDLTLGNLETTIGENNFSGYPFFKSPKEYLSALKDAGFDFLFTSNNHSLDKGESGVLSTLKFLGENKINSAGTYTSFDDRDSIRLTKVKGINIAMLSYSYGTNGINIPKGKEYLINLIDTTLICDDITRAESLSPDLIIVYFHFGEEYSRQPSVNQKMIVQRTIDFGADIILASHPHVIQPVEIFKPKSGRIDSGFVAYSLGNFISNQRWRYSDSGVILNFIIEKKPHDQKLLLKEINFMPTWVFKDLINNKVEYRIFPSESAFSDSLLRFLSVSDRKLMKQSYYDTKNIISQYTKRPIIKNIPEVKKIIDTVSQMRF